MKKKSLVGWIALSKQCNSPNHYGYFFSRYKKEALKRRTTIQTTYLPDRNCPFPYVYTDKAIKVRITIEEIK